MDPRTRRHLTLGAAAIAIAALLAGPASAEEQQMDVQEEIRQLKAEVARLRAKDRDSWLSERRKKEVRSLVQEVMADADTRTSFQEDSLTAGHDGSHFFLADPDGDFLLELAGHFQLRYTYNRREGNRSFDEDAGAFVDEDRNIGGFSLRRIKFQPSGYVTYGDRRIYFDISLAGSDEQADDAFFEDYTVATDLTDNLAILGGRFKQPFALQNIRSSSRQLAVERSAVHETFTVDRSEGVMLTLDTERVRLYGAINDGREAERTRFEEDDTDVAFTGRGELLLAGDWDNFKDVSSWSGDPFAAMLGAAAHYEIGETGTAAANDNFLLWTADLSVEGAGFGAMFAGYGHHTDNEAGPDFDDFGLLAEAGYMVIPDTLEPFVRWQTLFQDEARLTGAPGEGEEETSIATAGLNWYHAGHDSKFTLDVSYAFDPLVDPLGGPDTDEFTSGSIGWREDDPTEDGQILVRAQYQFKW